MHGDMGEIGEIGEMGDPGTLRLLGLWLILVRFGLGEETPDEEAVGLGVDSLAYVLDGVSIVSWGISPSWNRVSDAGVGAGASEPSVDCLSWPEAAAEKVSHLDIGGIC